LHSAPVAVESVLLVVHARRRTCLVVERAQTREPPVPLGGWLPHRVPALNDLDNLGLTIGGPSHHPSSLTNSKRNLRVLVDRQLADLEGLPKNSLISSASYSASSRVRYALRPKNLLSMMKVNTFVGNFGPESYSYCWMVSGFGSIRSTSG